MNNNAVLSNETLTYFYTSSAVIAALLALTTIVFSHYNERILQKYNELCEKIAKNLSSESSINYLYLNSIIQLAERRMIYKCTLRFFCTISFISALLWLTYGIVNIFNIKSNSSYYFIELIFSILSGIVVTGTFTGLPILLFLFNKENIFKLGENKSIKYNDLIDFFTRKLGVFNHSDIVREFVAPNIELYLDDDKQMILKCNQLVNVSDYSLVLEFVSLDGMNIYLNFNLSKFQTNSKYLISYENEVGDNLPKNNLAKLFGKLKIADKINLFVLNSKSVKASYKMLYSPNEDDKICLEIGDINKINQDIKIIQLADNKLVIDESDIKCSIQ